MNHQDDFGLEYASDTSISLEDPLGYIAVNLRDPLNSIEACCEILLRPEYKENQEKHDFALSLIPNVLANFELMQAKVEKLAKERGRTPKSTANDFAIKQYQLSDIEKISYIPVATPLEEVFVELAQYFNVGTASLRKYANKLLYAREITSTAKSMKDLVVSMKGVLEKLNAYLKERTEAT